MTCATDRLGRVARGAGRAVLDLLIPPTCLTCDQPVGRQGELCAACFARTRFITAPCCERCGVPFRSKQRGGAGAVCPSCTAEPPPWSAARAALRYDEQAKRLILPLKYGDRVDLAAPLALWMARAGGELLEAADWLVPVPLHWRRRLARRYNQAALLALALARQSGRPTLVDALRRVRATKPLADLSPTQRSTQLERAITTRPARRQMLEGSRVLLVDDVLTSGATARACVAALEAAGVLRVDVLAAARVRSEEEWEA